MVTSNIKAAALILFFIGESLHGETLPYYDNKNMTRFWPARVTHFKAIDQDGRAVDENVMKGHSTLVNFFFVQCPGVCPAMMRSVQKIQKALAADVKNVQILSFSVKPDEDTPEKLKEYSKTYGIDGQKWKLLTGSKKDIYRVGKEMFKAEAVINAPKKEDSFVHTQNIYLVDKDFFIRGIYNTADEKEMKNLADDIRRL